MKNINIENSIMLSVDTQIPNIETTTDQEMKEIQAEIKEKIMKGIDKIEINQFKEEIIKIKKVKNKGKIKIDQDQGIENMIKKVKIKIMIVKETDNQKNNHARKRIEKDHILPNRLNKINVHDQSHKEIVKREENKRKIKMTFKELKLSKKRFQKIEKTKRTERNKVEKLANHNHMTETLQTQVQ